MLASLFFLFGTILHSECAVLDPALFLSPSPPLTSNAGSILPGELWTMPGTSRVTRDVEELVSDIAYDDTPTATETMEGAETFWSRFRVSPYGLSPVHIPLTFSISGTYGGDKTHGTGVIGSSYASVSADEGVSKIGIGNYGKSSLAGSSYGTYGYPGVRIFGSSGTTGWSGWGNGKWGHYGKG